MKFYTIASKFIEDGFELEEGGGLCKEFGRLKVHLNTTEYEGKDFLYCRIRLNNRSFGINNYLIDTIEQVEEAYKGIYYFINLKQNVLKKREIEAL
jgi:hypothetical protein